MTKQEKLVAALVTLATLATLASPASAFAQNAKDAPAGPMTPRDDYRYVFPDDPLDAGFFGADDVHIQVWRTPQRSTLIRLRTQFVPEMLKSVEAL